MGLNSAVQFTKLHMHFNLNLNWLFIIGSFGGALHAPGVVSCQRHFAYASSITITHTRNTVTVRKHDFYSYIVVLFGLLLNFFLVGRACCCLILSGKFNSIFKCGRFTQLFSCHLPIKWILFVRHQRDGWTWMGDSDKKIKWPRFHDAKRNSQIIIIIMKHTIRFAMVALKQRKTERKVNWNYEREREEERKRGGEREGGRRERGESERREERRRKKGGGKERDGEKIVKGRENETEKTHVYCCSLTIHAEYVIPRFSIRKEELIRNHGI